MSERAGAMASGPSSTVWEDLAAVILAGGAGTRLGGRDKPALAVGGVPMLDRVLGAVAGARQRIVVGPPRDGLPPGVWCVREEPPGSGPAAAVAAGLALVRVPLVALLAADLPRLTPDAVEVLASEVSTVDGAVFVDEAGRRQLLCGVWRVDRLRGALDVLGDPAGRAMRQLLGGLRVAEVRWPGADDLSPYFDCDTEEDLRRAAR